MLLQVETVSASYNSNRVLEGVSFEVRRGEAVGLLGRNGVGKSTALRCVMGLTPVTSGTITFRGVDITRMSVHGRTRLGIAYVPEDKGIFGSLTTYENLQVASIGSKRADIEWVMELFPILRERKKQVAALLSGGEQQLLTIARALIVKPQLLVLDEVSEGLSPEAIATLLGTLRQLQQKGAAILLAEQNVRIGLSASDRVYMVLEGQIVFAGTVDEALREGAVDKYIRI